MHEWVAKLLMAAADPRGQRQIPVQDPALTMGMVQEVQDQVEDETQIQALEVDVAPVQTHAQEAAEDPIQEAVHHKDLQDPADPVLEEDVIIHNF
ncbi:hypothetical protein DRF67_11875 [Chryseobacterium pennipullorum]|uniref:Uncharacterized protein n=1 Tax=Chryseobacterium pennipullorum TaxID=2258963 RepID=A0A3D9B0Y5_9FLAO|nr:hypothetical protein DRF67_11875 [Chryseobacterium pennipullorum]